MQTKTLEAGVASAWRYYEVEREPDWRIGVMGSPHTRG